MLTNVGPMCFEPPPEFGPDETMVSLRVPGGTAAEPGQHPASPSLIVHSKRARAGSELGKIAGEAAAELAHSLDGILNLSRAEFSFDDGATGVILAYDFPVFDEKTMRQYQVYRLDGEDLTTITLTVPDAEQSKEAASRYFRSIASLRPSNG